MPALLRRLGQRGGLPRPRGPQCFGAQLHGRAPHERFPRQGIGRVHRVGQAASKRAHLEGDAVYQRVALPQAQLQVRALRPHGAAAHQLRIFGQEHGRGVAKAERLHQGQRVYQRIARVP